MKFPSLNKDRLLNQVEEIANNLCSYTNSYSLQLYRNEEDFQSQRRSYSVYTPKVYFSEKQLTGNFGTAVKKLNYFYKALFPEYTSLTTVKSYNIKSCHNKLFYKLDTLYIFEWFYRPIMKDIEDTLFIRYNNERHRAKASMSSTWYKEDRRLDIQTKFPTLNKTLVPEEDIAEIESQFTRMREDIKAIVENRLSTLIQMVQLIIQGDQPVLTKEIGLHDENIDLDICFMKKKIFIDRAELENYEIPQNKEMELFLGYVNQDMNALNNGLKEIRGLNTLKDLYHQFSSYGMMRSIESFSFKKGLYQSSKSSFEVQDENPIFEMPENDEFYYFGKINKESFEKIQKRLTSNRDSGSFCKKFLENISVI